MPPNFWTALERLPGLAALPAVWAAHLADNFGPFKNLCLEPSQRLPNFVQCPNNCGCLHHVILRHDRTGAVASCMCHPHSCPDIHFSIEEITPLALNWTRLAFALCKALGSSPRLTGLEPFQTKQLGSWSPQAVPIILSIQTAPHDLIAAIGCLSPSLKSPFILLTPTTINITAPVISLLKAVRGVLVDLHSHVIFDENGTLKSTTPPDQLFAELAPPIIADRQVRSALPVADRQVRSTRNSLRKHFGVWHLIFDGEEIFIRHERALLYIVWLLYHPDGTPIHAIDLMAKIPEIYRQQLGLPEIRDPATGKPAPLLSTARLQERSLALDDRQAMRALYKKQRELEAILDSDDASEPEKAEAIAELQQLYDFQKQHLHRSKDSGSKTAHTVRETIRRFVAKLRKGTQSHQHLTSFAAHLEKHLLAPSAHLARTSSPGCFTYNPPAKTPWSP